MVLQEMKVRGVAMNRHVILIIINCNNEDFAFAFYSN